MRVNPAQPASRLTRDPIDPTRPDPQVLPCLPNTIDSYAL